MNTNNGLESVERILCWVLLIVDICLRNDIVFLMTANQVDMLLTVIVYRCLEAQLLVNCLVECLAEVRYLLDELNKFLQLQAEEYGWGNSTYAYC